MKLSLSMFLHGFELVLMDLDIVISLNSSFYSNEALDSLRKTQYRGGIYYGIDNVSESYDQM